MDKFIDQGCFYKDFHRQSLVFITHVIGVPFVFLSLLIFLNFFHIIVPKVLDTTLAELGTIILLIYYLRLNWRLGLLLIPVFIFLLWISHLIGFHGPSKMALWSFIIFLILGLCLQLIGSLVSKNNLSIDNLRRLFLAPLYLMAEACYKLGFLMSLNEKLHGKEENADVVKDEL